MKIIRKKMLFISVLMIYFLNISCSEDFLDIKSENNYDLETLDPTQVTNLLDGLYNSPWFQFNDKFLIATGDFYTGNAITFDGDDGYKQLNTLEVNNTNGILNEGMQSLLAVVNKANFLINIFKANRDSMDEVTYNHSIATARFMRATAYFYLVRFFGEVPIIDDSFTSETKVYKNFKDDVYRYIIEDLQFGVENLKETESKKGRVVKDVAKAMLAKVYLTIKEFNLAASLSLEVINNNKYKLLDNYGNLFNNPDFNNNDESLFALQWIVICDKWFIQNTNQAYIAPNGANISGTGDGWGSYLPTISLQAMYDSNDLRRKPSIMLDNDFYPELKRYDGGFKYLQAYSGTRSNFRKYIVGSAQDRSDICFMRTRQNTNILRYADVLLTHSEAVLGNGNQTSSPTALDAFNQVRMRAGMPTVALLTKEDLFKERRIEFALEGQYFFDLQRRGAEGKAELDAQDRGGYDSDGNQYSNILPSPVEPFKFPFPSNILVRTPTLQEPARAYYN